MSTVLWHSWVLTYIYTGSMNGFWKNTYADFVFVMNLWMVFFFLSLSMIVPLTDFQGFRFNSYAGWSEPEFFANQYITLYLNLFKYIQNMQTLLLKGGGVRGMVGGGLLQFLLCTFWLLTDIVLQTEGVCRRNQFRCNDGTCVDRRVKCDRYVNCPDGSDEFDCGMYQSQTLFFVFQYCFPFDLWKLVLCSNTLKVQKNMLFIRTKYSMWIDDFRK